MNRLDAVDGGIRRAHLQVVPLPVEVGRKVNIAVVDIAAVAVVSLDGESTAVDDEDEDTAAAAEVVVAFVDVPSNCCCNCHH